jgi:hypothetical protein
VRVVDRDRGPVGEHGDRGEVARAERPARLLGQVEIAPRLPADEHRHAEERVHRRVPRRQPEGARMRAEVVEDDRARVLDQQAEDAAPARELADRRARLGAHARGQEALKPPPAGVEHAERRVAGAGQLPGHVDEPLQHHLEVELGDQRPPRLE